MEVIIILVEQFSKPFQHTNSKITSRNLCKNPKLTNTVLLKWQSWPLWKSQENWLWGQCDKEAGIRDTLMCTHNRLQLIVNWFTSIID